jgi:hypothetical protein
VTPRVLRAILWLQWRLFVNGLRSGRQRGKLEAASRLAAAAGPIVTGLLLVPVTIGGAVAGAVGGYVLATRPGGVPFVAFLSAIVAAVPTLWLLARPFSLIADGRLERSDLLRLLPIPLVVLRHLELLRAAAEPAFLVFAPGLVAVGLGALAGGRPLVALLATAAGCAFFAMLACVSSAVALATHLVLRDRRRGEIAALIFVLTMSSLGILPQFFAHERGGDRPRSAVNQSSRPAVRHSQGPPDVTTLPIGLRVLPPFLYAQVLARGAAGDAAAAALPLGSLLALAGVGYAISVPLHRRLLETPETGAPAGAASSTSRVVEIPFISRPVAAVAVVQLRAFLRTVRGKMTVFFAPLMGVLMTLAFTRGGQGAPAFLSSGYAPAGFVVLICLSNLGVLTCNQFASSARGLILELLLPLDTRSMLRGRALASTLLCALSLALGFLPLLLMLPKLSVSDWIALFLAGMAAHITMAPLAAALSAVFPKASDLSRVGHSGQPHPAAGFIGFAATPLAAFPPVGCILLANLVLGRAWLAPVLVGGWVALATVGALGLLSQCERIVAARSENLAMVAAGK